MIKFKIINHGINSKYKDLMMIMQYIYTYIYIMQNMSIN